METTEEKPRRRTGRPKGGTGVNWAEVRAWFVTGPENLDLKQVAEHFNVGHITVARRSAREGWLEEKRRYLEEVHRRVVAKAVDEDAEIRSRHRRIGVALQGIGMNYFDKVFKVEQLAPTEARMMVVTGIQIERSAVGMTEDGDEAGVAVAIDIKWDEA